MWVEGLTENVEFDPPLEVSGDGTMMVDMEIMQWEGEFSSTKGFSGDWTGGDCGGSWSVTGEGNDDFGFFLPETGN